MALFRTFTLDGENSADYGLYISGEAVYNAPARAVEMVTIPGRNGALAMDQGYFENIPVSYPAGVFANSQKDFAAKMDAIRNWLGSKHDYVVLTDDYHPEYFRMALFKDGLNAKPVRYNTASQFSIVFECKPQRFLLSGNLPFDLASDYQVLMDENGVDLQNENGIDIEGATVELYTITNPTKFDARPLIRATGSGTIGIGTHLISIFGIKESTDIYIDSDAMEIYTLSGAVAVSAASNVSFNTPDFPVIKPGTQGLTHTMPIEIIPRWWRL